MPYLTQLAKVAKRTGYPVTEVPGWTTRGHGPQPSVQGIVAHHTAGHDDMHVVRDGRPGLDGPLSQFWLRRDGRIFVVAAGRCWHNAPSTSDYHTNSASIGIEAENDGKQSWPAVQLDAYRKLCAELCREFRLPASRVKGHKEVQPGKPDPHHVDMNAFRRDVAAILEGEDMATPDENWNRKYSQKGSPVDGWQQDSILANNNARLRNIETKLDAAMGTIDRLADALGNASVMTPEQVQELKDDIRDAIDSIVVHVDTDPKE